MTKKKKKRVRKTQGKTPRRPSGKPKHSKVRKLKRLARKGKRKTKGRKKRR